MDENKFKIIKPQDNITSKRQLKGQEYVDIMEKVKTIALYQKNYTTTTQRQESTTFGIKGFLFHGDVGIGKTTIAKIIASEMGVPLLFIDGSDIARKFYGDSEGQVSKIFNEAKKYNYIVVLIDDAESVFPTRDWAKSESWHFAQNNVFFHQLDNIDTSKIIIILTTNRYDLIDKAVKDRLYGIEFPLPSKDILKEIAKYKCNQLGVEVEKVYEAITNGMKTVRELEKVITELYIEEVLRKKNII